MNKTVICHFFYPDISRKLLSNLIALDDEKTTFLINIQGEEHEHSLLLAEVKKELKNFYILKTPNKGRDIGGKLFLISLLLELNLLSDYTLIIHDKKSPHLEQGHAWRDELFKIIKPRYLKRIFEVFEKDQETGIISSIQYIQNEYIENSNSFACNCSGEILHHLKKYSVQTVNYDFVAGNIFWIRTALLRSFFKARNILQIRADLETGNALDFTKGTYIHSWERIMSWIATSQGYKIYGI